MKEYYIEVPGRPPSVNHYVRHARGGHYKTPEAEAFAQRVALAAGRLRGMKIEADAVEIVVELAHKQRGDIDNFPKVVLDSLVRCSVIRSDASITKLTVEKYRGETARTEITIQDCE